MKILVFCALIIGLEAVYGQTVSIQPYYTSPANSSVIFTTKRNIVLSCNVTIDGALDPPTAVVTVEWKKDGTPISEVSSLKNRFKFGNSGYNYSVTISDGQNHDVGNYSCHAMVDQQEKASSEIHVVTTVQVKIKTENINVVEEEKLRIECSVLGNPYPALSWKIETTNYNGTYDERVRIEDYTDDNGKVVENGVLVIDKVNKDDRGLYYCIATNKYWEQNREESHSMIRVKDKYAALWPFLGICIEVVVLCLVIIIYEKKRNKTELEESDTDQSPDQKNTPDHGKENLRHRQ